MNARIYEDWKILSAMICELFCGISEKQGGREFRNLEI